MYTYFYHGFNLKAITTEIILITALHESPVIIGITMKSIQV
jgi:hypothetical protein